jgi:hypothetical protein
MECDEKDEETERLRLRGQKALREPLGKWSGRRLVMQCPRCPRRREIVIEDLAEDGCIGLRLSLPLPSSQRMGRASGR